LREQEQEYTYATKKKYMCTTRVWIYPSEHAAWHFVTIDKDISQKLREAYKKQTGGFGSIPVTVTIGKTTWDTSLFPHKQEEAYILPLKQKAREGGRGA